MKDPETLPPGFCPECGEKTLEFIETREGSIDEVKTSWTCECCENIVYISERKDT